MKIVVLDGATLNPGDLSWDGLEALGELEVHERSAPDEVVARAAGAEIVLTNKTPIRASEFDQLPDMRYIGVLATGYNVVDMVAAAQHEVVVTNVPTYGTQSVAEHVMAHMLTLGRRVEYHAQTVAEGRWGASPDFCYWDYPQVEFYQRVLGIVGLGRIGAAVARAGQGFGMEVLAYEPAAVSIPDGVTMVAMDEVFSKSDVVSLHCPLTAETTNLVNAERLALMKPSAFLINTSRGGLVDEHALADALNAGRLAGAGLDVVPEEPPQSGSPLFSAENCFVTPHIAWSTMAARARLLSVAVRNLECFLEEKPENQVLQ